MFVELLDEIWIQRLQAFDKLIVGFSGGLDSTVLLHLLAALPVLKPKIHAIHVNHHLSEHACAWQNHCADFCQAHQILFTACSVQINTQNNIEETARTARYEALRSQMTLNSCILLAHHQDDQAETILLNLCRGAGLSGLCGMAESRESFSMLLLRPLLLYSREQLLNYAKRHRLVWIEDDSNENLRYSRNFLRHQVLPLLQQKWPGVNKNMSQCTLHLREAEANLRDLAYIDCPQLAMRPMSLLLSQLLHLPVHRMQNILRVWFNERNLQLPSTKTFQRIIHEVIRAREDANPCVQWHGIEIRRYRQTLYLLQYSDPWVPKVYPWVAFPSPLQLTRDMILKASPATSGVSIPKHSVVEVRFRQGGEHIVWQGKTRVLKKLMQTWGVPPWLRAHIPLIYVNQELVSVLGFCERDPMDDVTHPIYRIDRSDCYESN